MKIKGGGCACLCKGFNPSKVSPDGCRNSDVHGVRIQGRWYAPGSLGLRPARCLYNDGTWLGNLVYTRATQDALDAYYTALYNATDNNNPVADCETSESGCCNDGITNRSLGCGPPPPTLSPPGGGGCQDSTYGCCTDGVTARVDTNGINCPSMINKCP